MQHAALRQMAVEILTKHKAGIDFPADTVGWATWITFAQTKRMPPQLGEHQTQVIEALMRAPLEGMVLADIEKEVGGTSTNALHQVVHKLVKHGLISHISIPHRTRYFLCDQMRELGRAIVEADETRLKASMAAKKPLVVPKFVTPAKKKPSLPGRHPNKAPLTVKQKKQEAEPAYRHHTLNQPPTGPAVSVVEQALGGKVKVTVHPTPPDRFAPRPGDVGAGFMDDWKNKRGDAA